MGGEAGKSWAARVRSCEGTIGRRVSILYGSRSARGRPARSQELVVASSTSRSPVLVSRPTRSRQTMHVMVHVHVHVLDVVLHVTLRGTWTDVDQLPVYLCVL